MRTARRRRGLAHVRLPARNREPPEQAMHHFRIVNLRSLYSRDRWPPPRPALTIFVRLLPRLLDPVHGPIQKCKTVLWLGLVWLPFGPRHTLRLTQLCHRATKTAVVQHRTMRRGTIARITMLAGVARALLSRGRPRVARPARQLRSSAPLRMAASTLEGLRNVAIVAHVRRSVRKQCQA